VNSEDGLRPPLTQLVSYFAVEGEGRPVI